MKASVLFLYSYLGIQQIWKPGRILEIAVVSSKRKKLEKILVCTSLKMHTNCFAVFVIRLKQFCVLVTSYLALLLIIKQCYKIATAKKYGTSLI